MPHLHWIGKEKVIHHHNDVRYRPLVAKETFGDQEAAKGNMIIHGDNLEALKSLLPQYEGRVDCIYIDPPYNTGNEGWVYNDNVNHPKIKKWLGEVVGKEDEDLSRHDKWLCMMYPRLKLLQRLLAVDGVIVVSIDEIELGILKDTMDEVFGSANRVGVIVWRNVTDNNPTLISVEHEYLLVYAKQKTLLPKEWKSSESDVKQLLINLGKELIEKYQDESERQAIYTSWFREHKDELWPFDRYKYIDEGGIYTGSQSVHNPGKEGYRYDVFHPATGKPCKQPLMGYRFPPETMDELLRSGRVLFGEDEEKLIELKLYVQDYRGKLPSVIEMDTRMGTNEIKNIFPESKRPFDFPKPSALLNEIFSFTSSKKDAIVLDSFAGSGTTAHAVMKLNAEDQGSRKYILVELEDYANDLTAERVRRVIRGYGEGDKAVEGLGGGFTFYDLGAPMFDEKGNLSDPIDLPKLREYVWYVETKAPYKIQAQPEYLGCFQGIGYYLLMDDSGPIPLTYGTLGKITQKQDGYVIYGESCALSEEFLQKNHITFKKIPNQLARI